MRIFIAARIPDPVREGLSRLQSSLTDEGLRHIRWVRSSGVHLTLRFCGEISPQVLEQLSGELAPGAPLPPFATRLTNLDVFPRRGAPRVLFVGLEDAGHLLSLADWIEKRVQAAGLPPESRPFHPHLTLGRFLTGARQHQHPLAGSPLPSELQGASVPVDSFALFRSQLGSRGPSYEALREYPLLGGVAV
jgi:2'-5' RNA ligase